MRNRWQLRVAGFIAVITLAVGLVQPGRKPMMPGAANLGWPTGMRVIVRRERPQPGAQLSLLEEADGWRYQALATNTATGQLGFLEARHRAHARVEDRIKAAKDTGLGQFPSREYADQSGLAADRRPRRRSDRLVTAACPRRRPGRRPHQGATVPDAARPRPASSAAAPSPTPPAARPLAVGRPDRRGIPPDHDHPGTHLNQAPTVRHRLRNIGNRPRSASRQTATALARNHQHRWARSTTIPDQATS